MITPVEIQGKVFKTGFGYDKKEVDKFLEQLLMDFEELYTGNSNLNEEIDKLKEKLDYYTTIEKTLQRALILAEKAAEETRETANRERNVIVQEANVKAHSIIIDAKDELDSIRKQSIELIQQYEVYKSQFKQLSKAQFELLESDAFQIQIANLSSLVSNEDSKIAPESDQDEDINLNEDIDSHEDVDSSEDAEELTQEVNLDHETEEDEEHLRVSAEDSSSLSVDEESEDDSTNSVDETSEDDSATNIDEVAEDSMDDVDGLHDSHKETSTDDNDNKENIEINEETSDDLNIEFFDLSDEE